MENDYTNQALIIDAQVKLVKLLVGEVQKLRDRITTIETTPQNLSSSKLEKSQTNDN